MSKKRIIALLLALAMIFALAACGTTTNPSTNPESQAPVTNAGTETPDVTEPAEVPADKVLVIGVDATFEEKWNPFLVESAYDHQVVDQIFTAVMELNEKNELVEAGGSISADKHEDGTITYTVSIKEGMTFSDGTPVTIDDYIYGLYVRADSSYTGPGQMLGSFIVGVEEYYYDDPDYSAKIAAFEAEAEAYTTENVTFEQFLEYAKDTKLDGWWNGDLEEFTEYIKGEGDAYATALEGIDATNADAVLELVAKIEYENYLQYYDTYNWFLSSKKATYAAGNLEDGIDVPEIAGIKKVSDYAVEVTYSVFMLSQDRGLTVKNGTGNLIPKHYYGDYEKGDVSKILANMDPMGSGPYIWGGFSDNIATCTANVNYFLGVPKTGTVRWQFIPQSDIIQALASGEIDIANPSSSKDNVAELESLGIAFDLIDNAGYGYMAMNCERVPLLVRKGLWSLMNRQPSVEGYYGPDLASVIERPMTKTLAEYPVDAKPYYTYSPEEALKYFEQAGYTQKDGKLVDANGKQLVVNAYIGGSGKGQHPAYAMIVQAQADMAKLGGEIQLQDVEFAVLQAAMNNGEADMWIMAWSEVNDCDKSEQFRSTGGQNRYHIADAKLDAMLDEIAQTVELEERRAKVATMLDYAMDLCIEFPLYQRKNMMAYNSDNLVMETVPTASTYYDYENVLWQVEVK